MAAGDLTTLDAVKRWVRTQGKAPGDDMVLEDLITQVSNILRQELNRDLTSQSYSEYYNGHGNRRLLLNQTPVTAVASVTVDGLTVPSGGSVRPLVGYTFDFRNLYLDGVSYLFTKGFQNVLVNYTAGYAVLPTSLERAVIETVGHIYAAQSRIGHKSKSLNSETVAFDISDFPAATKSLLDNFKRVAPMTS